ncbi:MAG TPA: hypothetical protein VH413_09835 [Verrucomicrobiae bacterium]|jgi:hypothetical protein|nr:hypothetical protein [Verrucomicrobiae bacterium]
MIKTSTSIIKYVAAALLLLAVTAHAEGNSPAGSWTWSTPGRNGGADRTNTLVLKIEDSKLTGKLSAPGRGGQVNETSITDGTVTGDTISFAVVREFNGNSNTNKYSGKVAGDQLTGKIEYTRNGEAQSRDWKATRVTEIK